YLLSELLGVFRSEFFARSFSFGVDQTMFSASSNVELLQPYLALSSFCDTRREPSNRRPSRRARPSRVVRHACIVKCFARISSRILFATRSVFSGAGPRVPRRFLGLVPRRFLGRMPRCSLGCVPAVPAAAAAVLTWFSVSAAPSGDRALTGQ